MRIFAAFLLAVCVSVEAAALELADPFGDSGSVCQIYCFDGRLERLVSSYYPGYEAAGEEEVLEDGSVRKLGRIGETEVRWVISPDLAAYESRLDPVLVGADLVDDDQRVDIYMISDASAGKYCAPDADVSVKLSEIGLGEDLAEQFPCVREIVTDAEGAQRAVTWQLPCGALVYRRGIAREVLGTDEPEAVGEEVSSWEKISLLAEKLKEKGYSMFASSDESFAPYFSDIGNWVDEQGTITVGEKAAHWVSFASSLSAGNYQEDGRRGSAKWREALLSDEPGCFAFFMTGPEIAALLPAPEGGESDYGICAGPAAYTEGGLWLCVAPSSDNKELCADILRTLTCDGETLERIARETGEAVSSVQVMSRLALDEECGSPVFNGQNHFAYLCGSAQNCRTGGAGYYDRPLEAIFRACFLPCVEGKVSEAEALDNFYSEALARYPDLADRR